jgi:hypothetical protein
VSSGQPVAGITVIADGAGLNGTAQSDPLVASIIVHSKANSTASNSVFVKGAEVQTITVHLTIKAVPYINASDVTLTSFSSGRNVRPGEPIAAGDRLTVAVKAFDADRLPISRTDLQLKLTLTGTLNGNHTALLELDSLSPGNNVYTATIPETWLQAPEAVQSAVSAHRTTAASCMCACSPRCCPTDECHGWRASTLARTVGRLVKRELY